MWLERERKMKRFEETEKRNTNNDNQRYTEKGEPKPGEIKIQGERTTT